MFKTQQRLVFSNVIIMIITIVSGPFMSGWHELLGRVWVGLLPEPQLISSNWRCDGPEDEDATTNFSAASVLGPKLGLWSGSGQADRTASGWVKRCFRKVTLTTTTTTTTVTLLSFPQIFCCNAESLIFSVLFAITLFFSLFWSLSFLPPHSSARLFLLCLTTVSPTSPPPFILFFSLHSVIIPASMSTHQSIPPLNPLLLPLLPLLITPSHPLCSPWLPRKQQSIRWPFLFWHCLSITCGSDSW